MLVACLEQRLPSQSTLFTRSCQTEDENGKSRPRANSQILERTRTLKNLATSFYDTRSTVDKNGPNSGRSLYTCNGLINTYYKRILSIYTVYKRCTVRKLFMNRYDIYDTNSHTRTDARAGAPTRLGAGPSTPPFFAGVSTKLPLFHHRIAQCLLFFNPHGR